jgi:hypothetical protein
MFGKVERGTKSKPIPSPHLVYGFLTTAPNAVVAVITLFAQRRTARNAREVHLVLVLKVT